MIRVLVNGASGRMGRLVCAAMAAADGLELVGGCGRGDDLPQRIARTGAQVVVDFTLPEVVATSAFQIVEAGACPVIGTSGLDAARRDELAARCRALRRGGLLAPNFAIGAVLMMRLAEIAARHLPAVEIVESHHPGKRDAPSGTAVATAERLAAARSSVGSPLPVEHPARGMHVAGIPVHSLRLPGLIAEQSVQFGELGQVLRIEHVAYGREAYVPGVLLACRTAPKLDRLVVGLDELLVPG